MKTFQDLFKRYRRPGDLAFAAAFFALSLALLAALPAQTTWVPGTGLIEQPAFWPGIAVGAMALFSGLHMLGALVSPRIPGRGAEVLYWLRALEWVAWFLVYVAAVPRLGYLPATLAFTLALGWRLGYRGPRWALILALLAVAVVVVFKALLQVRIPAGELYQLLPPGALRSFLMIRL